MTRAELIVSLIIDRIDEALDRCDDLAPEDIPRIKLKNFMTGEIADGHARMLRPLIDLRRELAEKIDDD